MAPAIDHYADSHVRRVTGPQHQRLDGRAGVPEFSPFSASGPDPEAYPIQVVNVITGGIFALVPWLHRFGELVAPLTFIFTAYVAVFATCWDVGTGSGRAVLPRVAACLVVLQLGVERIVLAALLAAVGRRAG